VRERERVDLGWAHTHEVRERERVDLGWAHTHEVRERESGASRGSCSLAAGAVQRCKSCES
jgi:hypothetical protein